MWLLLCFRSRAQMIAPSSVSALWLQWVTSVIPICTASSPRSIGGPPSFTGKSFTQIYIQEKHICKVNEHSNIFNYKDNFKINYKVPWFYFNYLSLDFVFYYLNMFYCLIILVQFLKNSECPLLSQTKWFSR